MTTHAGLLPAYKRLRAANFALNHRLVGMLSKDQIHEGARRLGILRDGILVLEAESEITILMDFCIHHLEIDGRNTVQRCLEESPPPDGSDEMTLLQAQRHAHYAILRVIVPEPGVGVMVHDVMRGEIAFLVDVGLGSSLEKGDMVGCQVIRFPEFLMTTGAALPVHAVVRQRVGRNFEKMGNDVDLARLTAEEEADVAAMIIRCCLEAGATEYVRFAMAGERPLSSEAPAESRGRPRANRNDPCPCGSGRKYKSCCGKRVKI
jgi:hypothetical protein